MRMRIIAIDTEMISGKIFKMRGRVTKVSCGNGRGARQAAHAPHQDGRDRDGITHGMNEITDIEPGDMRHHMRQ